MKIDGCESSLLLPPQWKTVGCLGLEIDFTMGLKLNLERYDKMLLLNYVKLATILSKLINAKSDGTLIAHYCFRNNEMQSEFRDENLTLQWDWDWTWREMETSNCNCWLILNLHIRRTLKCIKSKELVMNQPLTLGLEWNEKDYFLIIFNKSTTFLFCICHSSMPVTILLSVTVLFSVLFCTSRPLLATGLH